MKEYPKNTRKGKKAENDTENTTQKKNRFQISREVQEEFVNSVAESMLTLAQGAGKWQKPWQSENALEMPYCATTGREYGGSNMVKLLLASVINGYDDNRWMTFKQLEEYHMGYLMNNPDSELEMRIRQGEKGVKLLRPEEVTFIVDEDGKWKFLNSEKEIKKYEEEKAQGLHGIDAPEAQRMTLFYPFTVFNASQIEGIPKKEDPASVMKDVERNKFVEDFIASSGVEVIHHSGDAYYDLEADNIKMPLPKSFHSTEEYYAAKLHEFYHATGHESRENRKNSRLEDTNLKDYAFEELRAEMFSMLAGARFNLPMPESNSAAYIEHWNNTFSGGDAKAVFRATNEAAKMLSLMHQYELGEQPKAKWYPRQNEWHDLIKAQEERDKSTAVSFTSPSENVAAKATLQANPMPRPEPPSFEDGAQAFTSADNPVSQVRAILQNPKLFEFIMKDDSNAARSLAQLCDSFSHTLHHELDARQQSQQAQEQAQSASRMRM